MKSNLLNQFFLLFLLIPTLSFAQIEVKGTVTDEQGESLIGVNVIVKESTLGTVTDLDGNYTLNVPSKAAVLVFSYIGFANQEVTVGDLQTIDVVLNEGGTDLEEIVVVGIGPNRAKRAVGYSTEKVKGEELEQSNASNVISAIHGKMAGVNVVQSNGVEGGTSRIVIRGNNNITGNNQPLIIVDGVPFENDPGFAENADNKDITNGRDWGSAINNINPADIESMNVLKGANAAALYGARGKNGVIIIVLKKGKARKGLGVDYTFSYRNIQPIRFREVQNTFGAGGPLSDTEPTFQLDPDGVPMHPNQIYADQGPGGVPTTQSFGFYGGAQSWGPEMDGTMIRWWDGQMRAYDPQPDNIKLFYDNGFTANHNLAFSGGSDNGTIRVSFSRADHKAIVPNSGYLQNTANIGGVLHVTDRLRTEVVLNYVNFNRDNAPALANDANNAFESGMLYSFPRSYKGLNFNYENEDGTRRAMDGWPYFYVSPYQIWNTYNHNTQLQRDKWLGSVGLHYDITDWLQASGRIGVDNTNDEVETRRKPIDRTGTIIDDGSGGFYNLPVGYEHSLSKEKVINSEFLLTIHPKKILGDALDVSLKLGGNQWSRERYALLGTGARQWRDPLLYNFNNYQVTLPFTQEQLAGLSDEDLFQTVEGAFLQTQDNFPQINEEFYDKKINSLFGFIDLNYKNTFFLQLTGRNDWSSTLPIDNNSYFYPSANFSFMATEAFRDQLPEMVSHIKLRGALSQTANDDDPYQLNQVFNTGTFNGNGTGILPGNIPPITLKPQRANSWEVGVELGAWDDRLTADITYYKIHSFDQLLRSPVPISSGFNSIRINTGELDNQGIEVMVNARIINERNFSWTTGFVYAKNKNKLLKLDDGAEQLELASIWGLNGPGVAVKVGEPYGIITGFDYIRDEATGLPLVSEDGRHYQITETQVPIKMYDENGNFLRIANATPLFTGSWNNTIKWKSLSLSTLIDVKWGGDTWFGSYAVGVQSGQSPTTLPERMGEGLPYTDSDGETRNVGVMLNGVHEDGSKNETVVHYYYKYLNTGGWGRVPTTPGVWENSFIKLREVVLAWQLPSTLTQKTKVFSRLAIALSARDVAFLYQTAPDNINPEGTIGSGNAQGLEFGAMPGTRSFGLTLNASF